MYQTQDDCSLTTGGADYNMVSGPKETFFGKPKTQVVERFKNGTSVLLTFFYNDPWNNDTTGPVDFLNEPEVHLSCLRKVPTREQQASGSTRLGGAGLTWFVLLSTLWMGFMA